jgi:hypothetical protein
MHKALITFVAAPALLAAADAPPIQPGNWQTTATVLDVQASGLFGGMLRAMKGKTQEKTQCITPAQAADGLRSTMDTSKNKCRFTRYTMAGGHIDAALTCADDLTIEMTGSYTPVSYDIASDAAKGKTIRMKTRTTGKRIGACAS